MNIHLSSTPKIFTIIRHQDEGGISGVGPVLDGVVFPNGKVVVCWRVKFQTIAIYESFESFSAIHIDSHPINKTEVIWKTNFNNQEDPNPSKPKQTTVELGKFFGS